MGGDCIEWPVVTLRKRCSGRARLCECATSPAFGVAVSCPDGARGFFKGYGTDEECCAHKLAAITVDPLTDIRKWASGMFSSESEFYQPGDG